MLGSHSRIGGDISEDTLVDIYLIYPKNKHIQNPHRAKTKQIIFQWRSILPLPQLQKWLQSYYVLKNQHDYLKSQYEEF